MLSELLTALAAPRTNVAVIKCACGQIIFHPVDRWIVRCTRCGSQISMATLRDRYLARQQGMSEEQRMQEIQITQAMLDALNKKRQKTVDDVPAGGEIPCIREIKPGVFFGCKRGEDPVYDPNLLACVSCEWADVCKSYS